MAALESRWQIRESRAAEIQAWLERIVGVEDPGIGRFGEALLTLAAT